MKSLLKKILTAALSVTALAACLLCGCVKTSAASSYDWIIKTIKKNYYVDIPEDKLHKSVMEGGLSSVLDRYSAYYTQEEYAQVAASNSGSKSGVGISYMYLPEGVNERGSGVLITDVIGGSPAYASGLKTGAFVSAISYGGEKISITSQNDFTSFIQSKSTGEKFAFITDGGEYEMSKEEYTASYCTMSTAEKTYSIYYENGSLKMDDKEEGISFLPIGAAYIKLDQFYGNAKNEFAYLMEKYNAENCTSLILDLRRNGGGYVDVMQGISGIFTGQKAPSGSVAMTAVYKNGRKENFPIYRVSDVRYAFPEGAKLSVLADNGTASASEALIGALISYGIMDYTDVYLSDFSQSYLDFTGTADKNCRSYGKGIMQSTFENKSTGEVLKLTTAKIYWPNGTCIHDVGLNTEMNCKTLKTDWCVTYGDEQLAQAVKAIYG